MFEIITKIDGTKEIRGDNLGDVLPSNLPVGTRAVIVTKNTTTSKGKETIKVYSKELDEWLELDTQ